MRASPGSALPWLGAALASTLSIGTVLWSLPRGLDTTDEGYYLNEIGHPSDSSATALLFGWVWHPVFGALGGSVVGLRLVALALVLTAAVGLALATMSLIGAGPDGDKRAADGAPAPKHSSYVTPCLVLVVAGLAIVPWASLPATPSYNTLALLALFITALGCRYLWAGGRVVAGGALVGFGGFLAIASKPTTALVLGLTVLVLTPWSRRLVPGVLAACAGLLAPSAMLIAAFPGHLPAVITVVGRGVEATVGHPHLIRFDHFRVNWEMLLLLLVAGALGVLAGLVTRQRAGADPADRTRLRPALVILLGLAPGALATWFLVRGWRAGTLRTVDLFHPQAALYAFGLALALALAAALVAVLKGARDRHRWMELRFAALLACLPVAYSFGTNTNVWRFTGHVVVFWFLAILVLTRRSGVVATMAGGIAAYVVVIAGIGTPLAPYRMAPLLETVSSRISHDGQTIRLPTAQARATAAVLDVGERLAMSRRTSVLDLTGESPGVIWAWGARPFAQGWVIGGYPDSGKAARVAIAPVACQLDEALLLVWAPRGRRSLPDDVLSEWGVQVPDDYRVVAEYTVPEDSAAPSGAQRTAQVLEPVDVHPRGCAE